MAISATNKSKHESCNKSNKRLRPRWSQTIFNPSTHSIPFTLYPPNIAALKRPDHLLLVFFTCRVACSLVPTTHQFTSSPASSSSLRRGPPLPARSRRTALHRPAPSGARAGHGPPGHVPSGLGRLGYRRGPPGSGRLRPAPGVILARLRPTRITGRAHCSGRLGPSVQPRHMTPATAASPGRALPSRVLARHTPTGPIVQSPKADQYAGEEYVAATTTSSSGTPSKGGQYQGVSRIQRRPLFGTQCRPVGGPAGFEPHRHRTASCPATRACA